MLQGIINENDEPVVSISLVLKGGPFDSPAVVDTGFNGHLSIPQKLADKSSWYFLGYEEYEIATGEKVRQKVYLERIIFIHPLFYFFKNRYAKIALIGERIRE